MFTRHATFGSAAKFESKLPTLLSQLTATTTTEPPAATPLSATEPPAVPEPQEVPVPAQEGAAPAPSAQQ